MHASVSFAIRTAGIWSNSQCDYAFVLGKEGEAVVSSVRDFETSLQGAPSSPMNPSAGCLMLEMGSPVVLRRSARLTAKAAVTAAVVTCDRGPSSSPEQEAITLKHGRLSSRNGKKGTPLLLKRELATLSRGKISAYFSRSVASASTPKKSTKGKKKKSSSRKETTTSEVKGSESCTEILSTHELSTTALESDDKTRVHHQSQVLVKHERVLKKSGPSRDLEAELWEMGFQHIAGVDEAGRGPLAGPVVAAACIIPPSVTIEGINDSKKLTEQKREELYTQLTTTPGIFYAVHVVDAQTIDEINILQATLLAMTACVEKLGSIDNACPLPDFILVDGNRLPEGIPEAKARTVVKGDASCHVIAAASILAKVTRDRLMTTYDEKWPVYGFKSHKGYGTAGHIAALLKYGPCDIHRRSFAPLKDQNILSARDLQALQGGVTD